MAQSQIQSSNNQSTMVKTMETGTVDLSYKIKPHLPDGFVLPVVINKSIPNDNLFGSYTYFEINNSSYLSKIDCEISGTLTTSTADSTINSSWHPSQIVDRVEVRSPNGLLQTIHGEALKFYADFGPENIKNNSYNKIYNSSTNALLSTTFSVGAVSFYTRLEIPLFCTVKGSLTDTMKMDLRKYTDLSIYLYFKTKVESNIPSNMDISGADYILNVWNYVINQPYVDQLLLKNSNPESSKVITYDYSRSSVVCTASTLETTITSRKQNFIGRSFLRILPINPSATTSLTELPILTLRIDFNGTPVFQGSNNSMKASVLNSYSRDKLGASEITKVYDTAGTAITYSDNSSFCGVCVPWKMLEDLNVFSGGISTKDLITVSYTVTHNTTTATANSYRLVLNDEVSSVLDFDSSVYSINHFTPS